MLEEFVAARELVMEFLDVGGYSKSVVNAHRDCLAEIEEWLSVNGTDASGTSVGQWYEEGVGSWEPWRAKAYRTAASHLAMACEGTLLPREREPHEKSSYYALLPNWAKDVVDEHMDDTGAEGRKNGPSRRSCCSRFLLFVSECGANCVEDVTAAMSVQYMASLVEDVEVRNLYHILTYARDIIRPASGHVPKVADAIEFLSAWYARRLRLCEPAEIRDLDALPAALGGDDFIRLSNSLVREVLPREGYAPGQVGTTRMALRLLYCYLVIRRHDYSPDLAAAWVAANREGIGTQWKGYRRAVELFERYRTDGETMSFALSSGKPDLTRSAPEWARGPLTEYLSLRRREGLAPSSICSHKSACVRFCAYAESHGAKSFSDVTPDVVLGFSLDDPHSTSGARRCYVSKARAFLDWLSDEGMVRPGLSKAALADAAPSVGIVSVLSDEMVEGIMSSRASATSPRELRDAAMVMLGLLMGLRAIDVVGLRLEDISWRTSTVSILQQKTHARLELPLAPEAGNSIAAWIVGGRPSCGSPFVFVQLRAPYAGLSPCTCRKALAGMLGDLADSCTGFHQLRRTFATRMLRGGAGVSPIAEALGHRTEKTVGAYLSLDEERMRMCALPMSQTSVAPFVPRGCAI